MRYRNPQTAHRPLRRFADSPLRGVAPSPRHPVAPSPYRRFAAFTLLEVMVSMAILSILFVLLFFPLRLGMSYLHQGQGDIRVQGTLRTITARMEQELRIAMVVFPNDGGTTTLTGPVAIGFSVFPVQNGTIFNSGDLIRIGAPRLPGGGANPDFTSPQTIVVATRTAIAVSGSLAAAHAVGEVINGPSRYYSGPSADLLPMSLCTNPSILHATVLSRIDFQVPANLLSGGTPRIVSPLQAEPQIVTYYVRLRDPNQAYEERDNPLVLYRAQYRPPDTLGLVPTPCACHVDPSPPLANTQSGWLRDNADLEPVALNQTLPVGMHTALTPTEDLNVLGRMVVDPVTGFGRLVSDTTFQTEDTDHDGKVDKVTINLVVGRYDPVRRETVRETLRQTIDLKNTK